MSYFSLLHFLLFGFFHCFGAINYISPECSNTQYFDSTSLTCNSCLQNTTRSSSGLSCQCTLGYRFIQNFDNEVKCELCDSGQMVGEDGWTCVNCPLSGCPTCVSSVNITVERSLTGVLQSSVSCQSCSASTIPNVGSRRCITCPEISKVKSGSTDCTCNSPYVLINGVCLPESIYKQPNVGLPDLSGQTTSSLYLQEHLGVSFSMCKEYFNRTACQLLGNACTLLLFQRINVGSSVNDACNLFLQVLQVRGIKIDGNENWGQNMPWLYYSVPSTILTETTLTTVYTRLEQIRFLAAIFSLNGTFIGYKPLTNGLIQLCKNSNSEMNAAYEFGTRFSTECSINVDDLFDNSKYPLQFIDLFMRYTDSSTQDSLFPVPVRILNYKKSSTETNVNSGSDTTRWQFVRRFFTVDNIGAITSPGSRPTFVRYVASINITFSLIETSRDDKSGRIYPPLVTINYGQINSDDYGTGKSVQVKFDVDYSSTQQFFFKDLEISLAVLCSLAAVFAIFKTFVHYSRTSSQSFETLLIFQLLANACGAIGNMFLLVMYVVCIWFFSVYKNQTVFAVFIPTVLQETNLWIYIGVACGLKVLEVIYMIFMQSFVDIFFIDWEQPQVHEKESTETEEAIFWRTILIANEWNEIQTHRKTHRTLTVLLVLFFMSVLGFENYATADPQLRRTAETDTYQGAHVRVFRFALSVSAFIVVAGVQWIFSLLIMERFIEDKLRNFVDLCSVANVSVFIRYPSAFGYYIHGANPKGVTDVGISAMNVMLKEETTSHQTRGLDGTDQQTFLMRLPPRFISKFVQNSLNISTSGDTETRAAAYKNTNNFLKRFIKRTGTSNNNENVGDNLNVDGVESYEIRQRKFLEDALGMELGSQQDFQIRGVFYEDDGVSFGDILFYGNELTLITLDILIFVSMDLIFQSTALGAIVTWVVGELIDFLRHQLSEVNLANKTQIDRRFLI